MAAGPVYRETLADILATRHDSSILRSIGDLAGALSLFTLTCNFLIQVSCIPYADLVLDAVKNLSGFLKNYDFDQSIYVFKSGSDMIKELDNTNDTKGMSRFSIKNGELIQWMTALNDDFWVKGSKGFAATVGDIVIFVGKIKGDNSWIQLGRKN